MKKISKVLVASAVLLTFVFAPSLVIVEKAKAPVIERNVPWYP